MKRDRTKMLRVLIVGMVAMALPLTFGAVSSKAYAEDGYKPSYTKMQPSRDYREWTEGPMYLTLGWPRKDSYSEYGELRVTTPESLFRSIEPPPTHEFQVDQIGSPNPSFSDAVDAYNRALNVTYTASGTVLEIRKGNNVIWTPDKALRPLRSLEEMAQNFPEQLTGHWHDYKETLDNFRYEYPKQWREFEQWRSREGYQPLQNLSSMDTLNRPLDHLQSLESRLTINRLFNTDIYNSQIEVPDLKFEEQFRIPTTDYNIDYSTPSYNYSFKDNLLNYSTTYNPSFSSFNSYNYLTYNNLNSFKSEIGQAWQDRLLAARTKLAYDTVTYAAGKIIPYYGLSTIKGLMEASSPGLTSTEHWRRIGNGIMGEIPLFADIMAGKEIRNDLYNVGQAYKPLSMKWPSYQFYDDGFTRSCTMFTIDGTYKHVGGPTWGFDPKTSSYSIQYNTEIHIQTTTGNYNNFNYSTPSYFNNYNYSTYDNYYNNYNYLNNYNYSTYNYSFNSYTDW